MTKRQLQDLTPDQISKLPSREIPALVTASIELDRDIKTLEILLTCYKFRLTEEAFHEADKSGIKETRGTTWNFNDDAGQSAQVAFPDDSLIKSGFFFVQGKPFRQRGKELVEMGDVKGLAGKFFDKLFAISYKPAKAFRELCQAMLGDLDGKRLIELCSEPSSPRVSFKTKE